MAIINISGGGDFVYDGKANQIHVQAALNSEAKYNIFTLGGADQVDLRDAHPGNTHYVYAGAGNDTVLGGAAVDTVADQSGADRYVLGGQTDFVFMGRGNDTVNGGAGIDWIFFSQLTNDGSGYVDYKGGVVCDLQLTTAQDFGVFGKDRLSNIENAFGSYGNDRISGTSGDNVIQTATGSDTLTGRAGRDFLAADAGRDLLIGGAGWDTMLLGDDQNSDTVKFNKITDSGTNDVIMQSELDNVIQFQVSGVGCDMLDFSAIDARADTARNDAFAFRGKGSFHSAGGEIRLVEDGGNTIVYVDNDADAAAEMVILITGATGLSSDNFIL